MKKLKKTPGKKAPKTTIEFTVKKLADRETPSTGTRNANNGEGWQYSDRSN